MTMKKIIALLTILMLSALAQAQPTAVISNESETEYLHYDFESTKTSETYIRDFIKRNGIEQYHNVMIAIENGTIAKEIQILRDKGLNSLADDVNRLKYMSEVKTSFVANGKYYVLTYKPLSDNVMHELTVKEIFLYRRDDDSMRIAGGYLRKDLWVHNTFSRILLVHSIGDIESKPSIYKITNNVIVIVTETLEWRTDNNGGYNIIKYNDVIVFNLNSKYSLYLEPEVKTLFNINKVSSDITDKGLTLKYASGTIMFDIDGNYSRTNSTIKLR